MSEHQPCRHAAPGGPGQEPRWGRGDKDAVGTAYSTSSRVWYTLSHGVINEVYSPTVDRPQVRQVQFLITDGETFVHDEDDLDAQVTCIAPTSLGIRVTSMDRAKRYRLVKEVIGDPHATTILIHTQLKADDEQRPTLKLFAMVEPHLEVGGWHNDGRILTVAGRTIFCANKGDGAWLAVGASVPFNDGRTDLHDNYAMDWEFDCALDGNIAFVGEVDLSHGGEFTLGLAFGTTFHNAVTTLFQSLGIPFASQRQRFIEQWNRACKPLEQLEKASLDSGRLYYRSHSLLLAHEDKLYSGAMIASLSIPWGQTKGDRGGEGGYHLVWTRDMVNSALGLLATNNTSTPLRSLIYLAASQREDGGFYQNFWVNGDPYWTGVQLDEVSYPILLAWRLHVLNALRDFDPYPMVLKAAAYLIRQGPATPQERWEEASGYSPSTLAVHIAALMCAAAFARKRGNPPLATFIQSYADFLECHVESWTVTTQGTLVPDIPRHFIRIHPVNVHDPQPDENPNSGTLMIANRAPWQQAEFAAKDIVDAGFLELVRYGIRKPSDPLIEDSLQVVDTVLKVDTPYGPVWRRYNHDGYGQRPDGSPFDGWGKGRAWPLLTGERGHYELAAGRPVTPYIEAMERFAHGIGLLTEQIWDEDDIPDLHLFRGRPTGAAMPLMWAHAEYIKLLRSAADSQVFDFVPEHAERYGNRHETALLEVWKPNRQVGSVRAGWRLRIQAPVPFELHWTNDEWQAIYDTRSTSTELGIEFVDIPVEETQTAPIRFTFRWLSDDRWEGRDYVVTVV